MSAPEHTEGRLGRRIRVASGTSASRRVADFRSPPVADITKAKLIKFRP